MAATTAAERLTEGCRQLGLNLDAAQLSRLLEYVDLLAKWNRAYNLTAVRDPLEMVSRHLLDSLAVLPELEGRRILDVGSGAGLPGIPLAIAAPERSFTLLDSNGKKTRFLFQVKTTLGLDNIEIETARVEQFHPARGFDCIITRAFAPLDRMLSQCRHLLAQGGVLLAMKGPGVESELAALPSGRTRSAVTPLTVPGLEEQRYVVRLRQPDGE